jgi:hypothetical protein
MGSVYSPMRLVFFQCHWRPEHSEVTPGSLGILSDVNVLQSSWLSPDSSLGMFIRSCRYSVWTKGYYRMAVEFNIDICHERWIKMDLLFPDLEHTNKQNGLFNMKKHWGSLIGVIGQPQRASCVIFLDESTRCNRRPRLCGF